VSVLQQNSREREGTGRDVRIHVFRTLHRSFENHNWFAAEINKSSLISLRGSVTRGGKDNKKREREVRQG
jgi:hypothetical protein